jgi:glycerol-3-phosphate dehydrogenase
MDQSESREMPVFAGSSVLEAELCYAAKTEQVVHLDDLLLRRTRLGLLIERGGQDQMESLRELVQPVLGWEDERWRQEVERYAQIWDRCYAPPA